MMVTGEIDHEVFGPNLCQLRCPDLPVAKVGVGPARGGSSQLRPSGDSAPAERTQAGTALPDVMKQRRPDQVLTVGIATGYVARTGNRVPQVGNRLVKKGIHFDRSEKGDYLGSLFTTQRAGGDDIDQPPRQMPPGALAQGLRLASTCSRRSTPTRGGLPSARSESPCHS